MSDYVLDGAITFGRGALPPVPHPKTWLTIRSVQLISVEDHLMHLIEIVPHLYDLG